MNLTAIDLDELAQAIRTMPEVQTLYPQQSAAGQLGAQLLDGLLTTHPAPLLSIQEHDGTILLTATLGLIDGVLAPQTGLTIGARIMEHIETLGAPSAQVRIRIATIG